MYNARLTVEREHMKTYVVLNDIQIPFQDKVPLALAVKFIKLLKPDGVVLNGDVTDCYELSTFDKDPLTQATLAREIKEAGKLMNDIAPHTKERLWLGGNHEDRLRRYIWKHAPILGVSNLASFESVFRVGESGFRYRPYGAYVNLGKLTVTHGSIVRQNSGWSAKAHFDRMGASVLIGHTHRLGIFYKTNMKGVHAAYENGCLCRLDPEYVQFPDWQQGFSVVHVGDGGWYHVQQLPILQRKFLYYGKERISL